MRWTLSCCTLLTLATVVGCWGPQEAPPTPAAKTKNTRLGASLQTEATEVASEKLAAAPAPAFVTKGLTWLVEAQHPNGGWGAGSHSAQQVRDPHAVVTDPATSAFVAMAILRSGSTLTTGAHQEPLRRVTEYLVETVAASAPNDGWITELRGTQPQQKLGPYIDTSMTLQFLSRIRVTMLEGDPFTNGVDAAIERCVAKVELTQQDDGSWGSGGWAPVLQSAMACSAMEVAVANGQQVDRAKLKAARDYQKRQVNQHGLADTAASAGIELYAFSGAKKVAASEAKAAMDAVEGAIERGILQEDAVVNAANLRAAGVDPDQSQSLYRSFELNNAQNARLGDDKLIAGFGNNGGEEYLSYLFTSESLVTTGGTEWTQWRDKMAGLYEKVQSPDGSWTGHHCITSPVFCTAAVLQCMTVENDTEFLQKVSEIALSPK